MKIYPNNSTLTVTKEVNNITDIPLSYIDTNAISYDINIITNEKFKIKEKKEVLPYDSTENSELCLFDKFENRIDSDTIIKSFVRDKNKYVYIPYSSKSFSPHTFEYGVVGKKTMTYSSGKTYNMNVFMEQMPVLSDRFISICGDASSRRMAPANIFINNGDLEIGSLNGNYDNFTMYAKNNQTDFSMTYTNLNCTTCYGHVTSLDAAPSQSNGNLVKDFHLSTYFKECSNLVSIKSRHIAKRQGFPNVTNELYFGGYETVEYKIKSPIIHETEIIYETEYFFNIPKDKENVKYHNIFNDKNKTPILIEERVGQGFIIHTCDELFIYPIKNSSIIYEVLLKVFLMSYKKTELFKEWITDKMPDYIVNNNKLIKKDKFTSNIEIHKMFGMEKDEIINNQVVIGEGYDFVSFAGMHEDFIIFEKIFSESINNDIPKPEGAMSIYTQRKDVMHYDDFIYSINDSIEDCIEVKRVDENIILYLKPFRHSASGIYIKDSPDPITIPLIKTINNKEMQVKNATYYLVVESLDSASYFKVISSDEYKESDGNILTTIKIKQNSSDKIVYDMRQRGGGLPSTEKDNNECFDIGHIKGRPYRKACTLIITLPKYLEPHKEVITETINQYRVAEDYPIIIFKED